MTKTMDIDELISELKEYDGELDIKVWSGGAEKPYPISNVAAGTMCAYIGIDDRNLVDLSKIWHDASEEPKEGTHILMEYSFMYFKEYIGYHVKYDGLGSWGKFRKCSGITRWAYIDDLLPKGGEK